VTLGVLGSNEGQELVGFGGEGCLVKLEEAECIGRVSISTVIVASSIAQGAAVHTVKQTKKCKVRILFFSRQCCARLKS